jgi:HEAT repeat protein
MSKPLLYGLVVAISFLTPQLKAATQVKLRGTVLDKASRKPIARATVTASGNQSKQDEVTDDKGFFRLVLEGSAPGSLVRIRAQKDGYTPYDEQMVVSEEKPIEILMTAAHAASHANDLSPVAARFIEQLKNPGWRVRANAIESLGRITPTTSGIAAAIAAGLLDVNVEVQLEAMYAIRRLKLTSKDAVTNLSVALSGSGDTQSERKLRALAALALGEIGAAARDAIPALQASLSDPRRSTKEEGNAALSLVRLGVNDPKVDASLVKYIEENEYVKAALLEMGPKAARFTPRLIDQLGSALQNTDQRTGVQVSIVRALEGIGPSGEAALSDLMPSLTALGQTRLAMAWVEVKSSAKPAILRAMRVDEVRAFLAKDLTSDKYDDLCVSGGCEYPGVPDGKSLRAAAGILLLGLEPRVHAWKVMLGALASDHPRESQVAYAAFVVGELDPGSARQAVPALVEMLGRCEQLALEELLPVLTRAIGRIGDQTAVAPLESLLRDTESEPTREAAKRALAAIQSRQ